MIRGPVFSPDQKSPARVSWAASMLLERLCFLFSQINEAIKQSDNIVFVARLECAGRDVTIDLKRVRFMVGVCI